MGRATSAGLATLVSAKLVVAWDNMAFAIDAYTEIKSLLWFESRLFSFEDNDTRAAAYDGSKLAFCSKLELVTSCFQRL